MLLTAKTAATKLISCRSTRSPSRQSNNVEPGNHVELLGMVRLFAAPLLHGNTHRSLSAAGNKSHLLARSCLLIYSISESVSGVALQELLEGRMGMGLAAMQEWAQKPAKERDKQRMAGSHLPERGFYLVKTAQSSLKESKPPSYWRQLNLLWSRQQAPHQSLPQDAKAGSTFIK